MLDKPVFDKLKHEMHFWGAGEWLLAALAVPTALLFLLLILAGSAATVRYMLLPPLFGGCS